MNHYTRTRLENDLARSGLLVIRPVAQSRVQPQKDERGPKIQIHRHDPAVKCVYNQGIDIEVVRMRRLSAPEWGYARREDGGRIRSLTAEEAA